MCLLLLVGWEGEGVGLFVFYGWFWGEVFRLFLFVSMFNR